MAENQQLLDCFTEAEMSVAKRCDNCSFWTQNTKSLGFCHRFPPAWTGDRHEFPITVYATWCGEFKASAAAIKAKHDELTKNPPDRYPWKILNNPDSTKV